VLFVQCLAVSANKHKFPKERSATAPQRVQGCLVNVNGMMNDMCSDENQHCKQPKVIIYVGFICTKFSSLQLGAKKFL